MTTTDGSPELGTADLGPVLVADPSGARWAYTAAALGTTANGLLIGFYALVPAAGSGNPLGPANDLVGSLASAAMIPAAMAIGRRLPARRGSHGLQRAAVAAMTGNALVGPALVAGVLPFPVATAVGLGSFLVIVVWILETSRWLRAAGLLPRRTARLGTAIAAAALAAAALAGAAQLLPARSVAQSTVLGTGGAVGVASFLAVPVWFWLMGRSLARPA